MKNIFRALLSSAICSTAIAALTGAHQARTADTCADPNLASPFVYVFSPTRTAHNIRAKVDVLVNSDAALGTLDNFQYQGPAFFAWGSAQEFTMPFYQLSSGNVTNSDFMLLPSVNGNPPTPPPGFNIDGIAGWAYATQICGSVPLYSAANAALSDHWWTTDLADQTSLLSMSGWVDDGIVFYVLPSDSCGCSSVA